MHISNYSKQFEKIIKRNYFNQQLIPYRKDAFTQFIKMGFPSRKWEEWRFTDLSPITKGNYRLSEINDAPKKSIDLKLFGIEKLNTIVIYNGHYQKSLSSIPNGIQILSGDEYLIHKNNKIETVTYTPFDLLNTAFVDSSVNIIVDKNIAIKSPIRILFISNGQDSIMVNPRIHLDMATSSKLTFVEHHVGNAKSFFLNESVLISMDDNAKLNHIRIQSNSEHTNNIFNLNVNQLSNSNYNFTQYIDGSALSRTNIVINLNGKYSESDLNNIVISKNNQHVDNNITINHNKEHTFSNQFFKTILFDKSSGVFNGKTVVKTDAQNISADQSNKNLLLSTKSKMNSNPQLEIYADNVKCSHASTTGEIDQDILFYIQSRGISKQDAIKLIVNGFANEVIDKISIDNISSFLQKKITTILEKRVK